MKMDNGGFEMPEGEDVIGFCGEAALYTLDKGEIFLLTCAIDKSEVCLLYTSPSPRDRTRSRMPSSA